MKSTYKLFGIVWNGIDDSEPAINDSKLNNESPVVSLKALLNASTEKEVENILRPFLVSISISIRDDYDYEDNPIIKSFVDKRKRQIKNYLSKKFKNVYYYST